MSALRTRIFLATPPPTIIPAYPCHIAAWLLFPMKRRTQLPHVVRTSAVDVALVYLTPPLLMREESGGIFRWLGVEVGGVPVSHGPLCFSHSSRLKVANGQSAWRLPSIHLMSRFSSEFSASSAAMSSANPFIQF